MVSIRRLPGPKNPAEMTYYVQVDGSPIAGASAAKTLNMVDSQTMALTLGYFVQIQAERMYTFYFVSTVVDLECVVILHLYRLWCYVFST